MTTNTISDYIFSNSNQAITDNLGMKYRMDEALNNFQSSEQINPEYQPLSISNGNLRFKIEDMNISNRGLTFDPEVIALDVNFYDIKTEDFIFWLKTYWNISEEEFEIKIDSLQKSQDENNHKKIAYKLVKNLTKFLSKTVEKANKNSPDTDDFWGISKKIGKITLEANSGKRTSCQDTSGGYVWAVTGFDFKDDSELERAKKSLIEYSQKLGVRIEKKDLKYFTKPCHFASLDVGRNFGFTCPVNRKRERVSLGKSFLLSHSWFGEYKIIDDKAKANSLVERRFSKIYNEQGKKEAYKVLEPGYKSSVNKIKNRYEKDLRKILETRLKRMRG